MSAVFVAILSQLSALRAVHFHKNIYTNTTAPGYWAERTSHVQRAMCCCWFEYVVKWPSCSLPPPAVRLVGGLPSGGGKQAHSGTDRHFEPSVVRDSARHSLLVGGTGVW